jgi:hypothetical protein
MGTPLRTVPNLRHGGCAMESPCYNDTVLFTEVIMSNLNSAVANLVHARVARGRHFGAVPASVAVPLNHSVVRAQRVVDVALEEDPFAVVAPVKGGF